MKKRIYIAGPMRGRTLYNFPLFDAVARLWRAAGWEAVNPADIDRQNGFDPVTLPRDHDWNALPAGFDMEATIRRDLDALADCQAIVLLSGWEESKGARAEKAVAEWMGLEVHHAAGRESILDEAKRLVHGNRGHDYGHPADDFARTAAIWGAILGHPVTAQQVGLCMVGVKLSRQVNRPKRDNLVDGAGYFETVAMIEEREARP